MSGSTSQRYVAEKTPEDRKHELALLEFERCRTGIENYDNHLFKIRSWNIALSALLLAAFFGVNVGDGVRVPPSVAIFIYVSIAACFWILDSFNKSLQMVHILNSRDVESYLRGTHEYYIGPSISLRFQRKDKRHVVSSIKNLTEESVMLFYMIPIVIFCLAVLATSPRPALCWIPGPGCEIRYTRILATVLFVILAALIALSVFWRGRGGRHKYFWRPRARERAEKQQAFLDAYGLHGTECSIGPFHADASIGKHLIFFDRHKTARNEAYLAQRTALLKKEGFTSKAAIWEGNEIQVSVAEKPSTGTRRRAPRRKNPPKDFHYLVLSK